VEVDMVKNNGNLKIPITVAVTIIIFIVGSAFGYSIHRIDKNTDSIMAIKEDFATKEDIHRLEIKIDKLLEKGYNK
jgi:hypothetical protein